MNKNKALNILVVDDDAAHRNMLRTVLSDWGYSIALAEDGEAAVRFCKEQAFDLVLMDVRMPKMSGLEALKEIKSHNPSLPILIMTAHSNVEAAVEAIKAGAYDYLTKPLDFAKLRISIKNIFEYTHLVKENVSLGQTVKEAFASCQIIGKSEPILNLLSMVRTIAPSEATVLITGGSGTGKELVAKAIHNQSSRSKGPYVAFNCAALAESLIESELFGHEKGAFTGADKRREGRFVLADKGTIFLDEIGEMPLLMQAKLLRVIQEREVQRVGGDKPIPVDVRILAATNRDLAVEVEEGRFREDLFYRLNVVQLRLPALCERAEDVPLLAQHFLRGFAEKNHKSIKGFTPACMDRLINYSWPGNVRELENIVERAVVLAIGDYIGERELPAHLLSVKPEPKNHDNKKAELAGFSSTALNGLASTSVNGLTSTALDEVERSKILEVLAATGGNKTEAAKRLGIARKTLHTKLQKYGV